MSSFDTASEDAQPFEEILDALSSETNRKILAALNRPMTAAELVEECDLATSTVYRKLDRLSDTGLVEEHLAVDSENGRCSRYERSIERVSVAIGTDDRVTVRVERQQKNTPEKTRWDPNDN